MTEPTYSQQWFAARQARADNDWRLMVPDIVGALGKCPESVIDFGCGDGASLRWFREAGAHSIIGVDQFGPDDWSRGIGLHLRKDLTQPIDLQKRAELVVCVEVAEHLPEPAADTLVRTLVAHGDRILFSAAPPGQGGSDHINEQPIEYWQRKFAAHGYEFQDLFRHRIFSQVSPWYRQNLFLVGKPERLIRVPNTKVTMARYHDCFKEVEDAIAELRHDPMFLHGYEDGVPLGAFLRPDSWQLLDDAESLEKVCRLLASERKARGLGEQPDERTILRQIKEKRSAHKAQHSRLLEHVYRSLRFGAHELAHSSTVEKMRSQLSSEAIDMREWSGCDYSLNIDADTSFRMQQALDLVVACHENGWDMATGVYCTKQEKARIIHRPPIGKVDVALGPYARPYRIEGPGFGFIVVRNDVVRRLSECDEAKLARTYFSEGTFAWDAFRMRIGEVEHEAIDPITGWPARPFDSEDFSFARVCQKCGIDCWVVPQIFVGHIGRKVYGMESLRHLTEGM